MTLNFKNAQDLDGIWMHWFLYGDTGSGKTHAAATFPNPVFVVPKNEGSIATLRGMDIPYYEVVDLNSKVVDGVGGMNHVLKELEDAYFNDPDNFPFDTIVIESLSHYADLVVEDLTNGGQTMMDQQKWGKLTGHLRNLQSRLRNMDVHVVFTALAKVDKSEDKSIIGEPLIQGQSAKKIPSACDVIGYCEEVPGAKNAATKWCINFRRTGPYVARTRFQNLPAVVDNFDFSQVQQYLRGPNNNNQETNKGGSHAETQMEG